jgi:hypothetical protein
MTDKERNILPVTVAQLEIIVEALNSHYVWQIREVAEYEEEQQQSRSEETIKRLAKIQETLQYVSLILNIRTKKLNEDVARSAGLTLDESTPEEEREASEKELGRTNRDPKGS